MQVQVPDAVVVFLSLAARYFDCMCSTPKVRSFDRLRGGSREVGAGRRQSQSQSREQRAAPRLESRPTRGRQAAGTLSASAREGSDWMGSGHPAVALLALSLAPTNRIDPCPLPVSRLGKHHLADWQGLPSPLWPLQVGGGGQWWTRQGFRGTASTCLRNPSRHAWMTFDCRPGVLQYLANLITAT